MLLKETKVMRKYEVCIRENPYDSRQYEQVRTVVAENKHSAVRQVCYDYDVTAEAIKYARSVGVVEG